MEHGVKPGGHYRFGYHSGCRHIPDYPSLYTRIIPAARRGNDEREIRMHASLRILVRYIAPAILILAATTGVSNAANSWASGTVTGGRGLLNIEAARTYGEGMLVFSPMIMSMEKKTWFQIAPGQYRYATDKPSVFSLPLTIGLTNEIDVTAAIFGYHDARPLIDMQNAALGYGLPLSQVGATYLGVKIRLPLPIDSRYQVAGRIGAFLDTSREELDGFNYFWTRKGTTIESSIYETVDLTSFLSMYLEQGYVISASPIYDDQIVGSIGVRTWIKNRLALGVEVNNRTFLGVSPQSALYALAHPGAYTGADGTAGTASFLRDSKADMMRDHLVVAPSLALRLSRFLSLGAGVNINIADQVSPKEKYQYVAGLTFSGDVRSMFDTDRDGVRNNLDREIRTSRGYPVDRFGVSLDSDGDGVPDGRDRQPDTPRGAMIDAEGRGVDSDDDGVYDGLDMEPETPHGSPVDRFGVALDDDHDGIPNDRDLEPATRPGSVVNAHGVSRDSDGDGVPDGIDVEPGTRRGVKVNSVGASLDTDEDGVPDGIDEEPNTPKGVLVDKKGRALVKQEIGLLSEGVLKLSTLTFKPSATTLDQDAVRALDEIGRLLIKYPTLRIQIEGHADDTNNPETNFRISRDRARTTLEYLLKRFPSLGRERFRTVGFGANKPPADAVQDARKGNRRVDFVVINRGELLRVISDN